MTAIELQGAGKRYWQLEDTAMLLRSILPFARPKRHELWALRNVDLKVEEGETVGILGRNGAGKTTLLRMLSGVTQPSAGSVTVRGRIAPLIGVGVGFHQEMSGRENVYVNGMLLGLTKAQVDERFNDIVAFSELESFIDTPVKFYSSGMFMRLGFSVAIHVEPRVLLVDEVLAVGDLAFQAKCFERMRQLKTTGTTVLIVSHSMQAIRVLCPRALLFRHGELELDGDPESVISRHHELLSIDGSGSAPDQVAIIGGISAVEKRLVNEAGQVVHAATPNQELRFQLRLRFEREIESPLAFLYVLAEDGTVAYILQPVLGLRYRTFHAGDEALIDIPFEPRLGGGTYRFQLTMTSNDGREIHYRDGDGMLLYLSPRIGAGGTADLDASILVDGTDISDHGDPMLR
jgi:ABC-type polysaccharide/polyol phosphate transport system ATPase subunit